MWIDTPYARPTPAPSPYTQSARGGHPCTKPLTGRRSWPLVLSLLMLVGCGEGSDGGGDGAVPPEASPADMASSASAASTQPETVGDLFPEGEGRELVLLNCASCHAVACAVMGQRTAARWNGLKEGHADRLPTLAEGELDRMFAYLQGHFNDGQPEPSVPAAFLTAGCTPF